MNEGMDSCRETQHSTRGEMLESGGVREASGPGLGESPPQDGQHSYLGRGARSWGGVVSLGPPGWKLFLSVQQARHSLCTWNAVSWHDSWPYYRALPEGWIF